MINTININLNGLNVNVNENLTSSQNKFELKGFLNDLFLLLHKSKSSIDTKNILFIPFLPSQLLTSQDIADLEKLFDTLKFQNEGLNSFYELIKSEQFKLNNTNLIKTFENLKFTSESKNIPSICDKINKNFSAYVEQYKDVLTQSVSPKNILATELSSFNFYKENQESKENLSELLNVVDEFSDLKKILETKMSNLLSLSSEKSPKSEEITINNLHTKIEQKLKNENLSLQVTLNSGEPCQHNNIQQKFEIPLIRLHEIPDIIFKALSTSQKTLIVQLEPPELGKILIKLTMDSSGIKADMRVDYPHVKEMLTNLIPEIKSNLQSSGVKISDFLLDLTRDQKDYSDSYYGQGQKKYKENQKFYEYFA